MRRIRDLLGVLLLIQVGLLGCTSTEPQIRPPKQPEEFNAPPDNDPRYNKPIEYPKDVMDQDPLQKKAKDAKNTPGPTGSPRSSGMTRPGSGGF